jgi:hypothetical protein
MTPRSFFVHLFLASALFLAWGGASEARAQVCPGDTGETLITCLQAGFTPATVLDIDQARDTLFAVISLEPGNLVTDVYTNLTITLDPNADPNTDALFKGLNVEHTLPQSKGATEGTPAHSNLHNLFPVWITANTDRSNFPFAEIDDANVDFWYCNGTKSSTAPPVAERAACGKFDNETSTFEPPEAHKGNAARAVFYMYTIYRAQADDAFFNEQKNILRTWHDQDPADADEIARASLIATYQDGLTNPFITDATLVDRAFFSGTTTGDVFLSEIRIDEPGSDVDEYFELEGPAATALDGLTYLVIGDGTGGSGVIEAVVDLSGQTVPASGFFVAAEATFTLGTADLTTTLNFENSDNVTHLLVDGFTGSDGQDLDTDDDGTLDATPWTSIVDCVALIEDPAGGDRVYCAETVGPDGTFVPGHVAKVGGGWAIGAFDPAGGDDTPGAPNAVLPVELTTFTARLDGRDALLSWQTASETNNAGFDVQSLDAGAWQTLGFVPGAGTTSETQNYAFRVDALAPGTHRFRLRQIDFDGAFAFSPVVELTVDLPEPYRLTAAFPNPFNPRTSFELIVRRSQRVTVSVFDVLGRRVATLFDGTMAANEARSFSFDGAGLPSGLYLYRAEGESFSATRRMTLSK